MKLLHRNKIPGRKKEQGVVILLVAIVLLFIVGAMAALAIDLVTFYTARSEAQLAADGAALAGARALANSGMTSNPADTTLASNAQTLATTVAQQVATHNDVGGRNLKASEVAITFPNVGQVSFGTNPQITVRVSRADLPTFFGHIWGYTQASVSASATAEAYNPSGANAMSIALAPVSAPNCVKPLVLPNMSPTDPSGATQIINSTGAIADTTLLDKDLTTIVPAALLQPRCPVGTCGTTTLGTPQPWRFYPGAQSSFPAPSGVPACSGGNNAYQNSIIGCAQSPIVCGSTVSIEVTHGNLYNDSNNAVNCLTNALNDTADTIDPASGPHLSLPFQFLTGADNPLVVAGSISQGTDVLVSDSIVDVPIYNSSVGVSPVNPVTVIGFVQLFINPNGNAAPVTIGSSTGILTRVINIAGCGTGASGHPFILGNGASAVPVRLISP